MEPLSMEPLSLHPNTDNGGDQSPENNKKQDEEKPKRKPRGCLTRLISWFLGLFLALFCVGLAAAFFLYNWVSQDLPDLDRVLEFKAPQVTTILARDGSVLGTLYHEQRYPITLNDMPKYLPMAFLAIEDSDFYLHPGVNPKAILRAFLVNLERGTTSQGGSTITQQIIKQMLLSSERSYVRKMKEAILALHIEQKLTKDQILLLYLNYIYLGQHSYGVEAAARTYFGKNAANLTLAESALIAGMPQAPSAYNPFRNPDSAKQRQLEVLGRLRTLEWITEAEYKQAVEEPLVYWSMTENTTVSAKWYFEEARRLLIEFFNEENLKALGIETNRVGEDYVYEAGLTVRTAMDPLQQELAGQALREGILRIDKQQGWLGPVRHIESQAERDKFLAAKKFSPVDLLGGAWTQGLVTKVTSKEISVALGNGYSGVISTSSMRWTRTISKYATLIKKRRSLVAGDVVWVKQANASEDTQTKKQKNSQKTQQAQSTKQLRLTLEQLPLVQGALVSIEPQTGDVVALIGGYQFGRSHFNRATQARRQPGSSFKPFVYSAALDAGFTPTSTVLDAPLEHVDPSTGKVWRPSNFEKSYRGAMPFHSALTLSRNTPTVRIAQTIGIDKVIERAKVMGLEPNFPHVLPVSLGAVGVSPLNITQAYTAFANGGLGVRPRIISSIVDANGRELYRQNIEHWQAISPQNAYQMATLLKRVVNNGTGTRARIDGLNIAGKTGTSNDCRDAWFVGFTPYLCTGIYIGYDKMNPMGRQVQGGRTAAPIFKAYRSKADQAYKDSPQDFTQPEGIVMADGLPFNGMATEGLSATEGTIMEPDSADIPLDTSEDSEELMRDMF